MLCIHFLVDPGVQCMLLAANFPRIVKSARVVIVVCAWNET